MRRWLPDSPLKTLYREAEEELGLAPSDLNEVSVLGLVYGEEVGVFQLICRASVEFSVGELASRECSGSWERETLVAAPTEAEEFKRWIVDRREKLTEAGYSALVMEGRRRWSDDWVGGLL